MKYFSLFIMIVSLSVISFVFVPSAQAQTDISTGYADIQNQGLIFAGICDSASATCECRDNGKCSLEDILQVLINLSVFILGISGSVMLLMFVYGGFFWLTSQGKSERVEKGRQAMVGAVIGLAIIFGAYTAINVVVSILKTGTLPESGQGIEDTLGTDSTSGTDSSIDDALDEAIEDTITSDFEDAF